MKKHISVFTVFILFIVQNCFSQLTSSGASTLNSSSPNQAAAAPIIEPAPIPPNVIAFDYDAAGNQIKRRFIYVVSGLYRTANQPVVPIAQKEDFIESDLYKDITYYPNPVMSELNLHWKNDLTNQIHTIELYNLSGQLMKRFTSLKGLTETIIDFQSYPSGYYDLHLIYSNGENKDLKILKK